MEFLYIMLAPALALVLLALPVIAFIMSIVSLCRYISGRYQNKKSPGTYSDGEIRDRLMKIIFYVSGTAVLVVAAFLILGLLTMPLAYM